MIRKIARPMLASVFVWDGVETLRDTTGHVAETESVLSKLRILVPAPYKVYIPRDPELVTRGLAGTKVLSGSLFALGKAPRTSAAVLALTHLPTVIGRNAFWDAATKQEKSIKQQGFVTNAALLGALAIITQDTEGNPSLRWRAVKATERAGDKIQAALPTKSESEKLAENISERASEFGAQAQDWLSDTSARAAAFVDDNRDDWESAGRDLLSSAKSYAQDAREAAANFFDDSSDQLQKSSRNFLDAAKENSKTARKAVVKHASKAQERADEAFALAAAQTGKKAAKAGKKADKLQTQADKAIAKALKQLKNKI